jgi:hypothetical protein
VYSSDLTASFAPHGCNFGGVPGASERQLLALGSYIRRRADLDANDIGGFGFALGAHSKLLNTDFKLYGLHTPATLPTFRVTVESPTPGPLAASYATLYPEDLPLVGLSFKHAFNPGAKLFGEVAYRPDQPLTLNVFDMFAGFGNRNPIVGISGESQQHLRDLFLRIRRACSNERDKTGGYCKLVCRRVE